MSVVPRLRNPGLFLAGQGDKFGNPKDCRRSITQIHQPQSFIYSCSLVRKPRISYVLLMCCATVNKLVNSSESSFSFLVYRETGGCLSRWRSIKDVKSNTEIVVLRAPVSPIHEAPDSFWRVKICKSKAVLTFILGRLLSWIQALSYPLGGWVITPRLS